MIKSYTIYSLRKRILACVMLISFIFFLLIIRLVYLQAIKSEYLQQKAENQWTRDLPITAERGKILDTNGATLAVSYTTYNVYTRPREIKDVNAVSVFLAKKLNMNFNSVYEKVSKRGVSETLIKMQISSELAEDILNENLDGIFLSENTKRYYPYGDLLTQILGFTTIDNVGQAGVESYYNSLLTGTDGYYMVQSDLTGKEINNTLRTYVKSERGEDLTLSINVQMQLCLEQVLAKAKEEQKAKGVTGIIMNAKTGEILAMSNKPSFDLNNIPRDDSKQLMEIVKNKCVVDVYEPGSTFKILTMSAAIESGNAHLTDRFYCGGSKVVDGQKIKCWRSIGHGSIDLTEGLVNSCNCVFMSLAERMGTNTFYSYLKKFGIGQKTGIEITGESSGILLNQSKVKTVDLARIGFGQTIAVTPIQLVSIVSSIVNGGYKVQPTILKQKKIDSTNSIITQETSNILNSMLAQVVNKTQKYSFVNGYDVGGKTGTAQKYENGSIARGKYISSFIGTYPASNPDYVMLLLVDEPSAGAYYGSVVAAPYAKEIFSGIFKINNISPISESETTPVEMIEMPYLIDKPLTEVNKILSQLGLYYEIDGDGGIVKEQLPPAGTKLEKYSTIVLCT